MAEEVKLESESGVEAGCEGGTVWANRAALLALLGGMREQEAAIRQGGGAKAAEASRPRGG